MGACYATSQESTKVDILLGLIFLFHRRKIVQEFALKYNHFYSFHRWEVSIFI